MGIAIKNFVQLHIKGLFRILLQQRRNLRLGKLQSHATIPSPPARKECISPCNTLVIDEVAGGTSSAHIRMANLTKYIQTTALIESNLSR